MAVETERKFLVRQGFKPASEKKMRIRQAYFSIDPARTIRLRIKGDKGIITFKSVRKGSFSRNEWEYEIPLIEAEELMKLCLPGMIDKTRYYIPAGQHIYEVDVFHGKNDGLIIAEIELKSESEEFEKPDWLGEEVTGKAEYYNSNLI